MTPKHRPCLSVVSGPLELPPQSEVGEVGVEFHLDLETGAIEAHLRLGRGRGEGVEGHQVGHIQIVLA